MAQDTQTSATLEAQLPSAGLARRLGAMLYDSMLLFGVLFIATLIYTTIPIAIGMQPSPQAVDTGEVLHQLDHRAKGPLYQLYLLAVIFGFFTWFWRKNGQTLGMQAWRLRIDNRDDDGRISYRQCTIRFAGAMVSTSLLGMGYWWILFDREGLSWHDRWSNSRTVLLPK